MKTSIIITPLSCVIFSLVIGCLVLNGCIATDTVSTTHDEPLHQFGWGTIYDVAWRQGERIAIATPLGIRFHHPDTLEEIDFWATETPVMALIYRKDGTLISGEQSGRITVWNSQGQSAHVLSASHTPCHMTISPDEDWLATSDWTWPL